MDKPRSSLWANRRCLGFCCIVAMANMQYGLDLAIVNSLQAMPGFLRVYGYTTPDGEYAIGSVFQQLIGSLLTLGAFLSSLVAGAFAVYFGRRAALWLACLCTAVGCAVQIASENKGAVYVGRLVLGVGNGFLVTFSNIYTSEAAPAHLRGVFVALYSEWVSLGSIVGTVLTNAMKERLDKASYQLPLGIVFVVPVVLSVGLLFVPESPRYLMHRGRTADARVALERLRGPCIARAEVDAEWAEMAEGIEAQRRLASSAGPRDMFRGTDLRRTLLCIGVIGTQCASGGWFLITYAAYFMIVSGLTVDRAFTYGMMNACIGLVAVNLGMVALRTLGRRTIFLSGTLLQGVFMLTMAIAYTVAPGTLAARNCLIASISLYLFVFNALAATVTYPLLTELASTRLRTWTVGASLSLSYFFAWLIGFGSPYFINPSELNWGPKYGYIFAASNLIGFLFSWVFVPETKDRSLEAIDALFKARVPSRKFATTRAGLLETQTDDVLASHSTSHSPTPASQTSAKEAKEAKEAGESVKEVQ